MCSPRPVSQCSRAWTAAMPWCLERYHYETSVGGHSWPKEGRYTIPRTGCFRGHWMDGIWMGRVWCGKKCENGGSLSGCCPFELLMVLPPLPPPLVTGGWSQTPGMRWVCGKYQGRTQHQKVYWVTWLFPWD